jgi:hypothetical protein
VGQTEGLELQFLAVAQAGKVAVDCVGLYMVFIRIGDAAEEAGSVQLVRSVSLDFEWEGR